jgi:hypothetical protein
VLSKAWKGKLARGIVYYVCFISYEWSEGEFEDNVWWLTKERNLFNCICSLSEGGTPPRFLIIDDGWQQIESKAKDPGCVVQEGAQ